VTVSTLVGSNDFREGIASLFRFRVELSTTFGIVVVGGKVSTLVGSNDFCGGTDILFRFRVTFEIGSFWSGGHADTSRGPKEFPFALSQSVISLCPKVLVPGCFSEAAGGLESDCESVNDDLA
jgi:hypothetical protein